MRNDLKNDSQKEKKNMLDKHKSHFNYWSFSKIILSWHFHRKLSGQTYFKSGCSQCFEVHFMPLSDNVALHGPVVHKVAPDISTSIISRLSPAQHHVVLHCLQQGHTSGFSRDSYKESKCIYLLKEKKVNFQNSVLYVISYL